jgi:hypothetical protein
MLGERYLVEIQARLACKPWSIGVNMSLHLSLIDSGKAAGGQAKVRTTLGKSDRVGSQGGLRKRELWWN